jgi:hypothetical protein
VCRVETWKLHRIFINQLVAFFQSASCTYAWADWYYLWSLLLMRPWNGSDFEWPYDLLLFIHLQLQMVSRQTVLGLCEQRQSLTSLKLASRITLNMWHRWATLFDLDKLGHLVTFVSSGQCGWAVKLITHLILSSAEAKNCAAEPSLPHILMMWCLIN